MLPARITATIRDAELQIDLTVEPDAEGVPVITRATFEQKPGGPPIGAALFRGVKLGQALNEIIERAAQVGTFDGSVFRFDSDSDEQPPGGFTQAALKRGRRTVTPEEIVKAAQLYNEAKGKPGDVFMAVARGMHSSRATAARRVAQARKIGLIKEATK